jgi:hypothetical protein
MTIEGGTTLGHSGANSYCQNCGHHSHCGVPLREERVTNVWGKHLGYVEICKNCRCKQCSKVESLGN